MKFIILQTSIIFTCFTGKRIEMFQTKQREKYKTKYIFCILQHLVVRKSDAKHKKKLNEKRKRNNNKKKFKWKIF